MSVSGILLYCVVLCCCEIDGQSSEGNARYEMDYTSYMNEVAKGREPLIIRELCE